MAKSKSKSVKEVMADQEQMKKSMKMPPPPKSKPGKKSKAAMPSC